MVVAPRLAILLVLAVPATAGRGLDLGFSEGERPVDIGRAFRSAEACADCHEREAEDWAGSRHRMAHSNAIYQAGLVDEPSAFCVNCHSPLPEQVDEVMANLDWYLWRNPRTRSGEAPARRPEARADEGVTCAACHVRDGVILGTGEGLGAPHAVRQVPELASPALCASCHEFRMPAFEAGGWHLTDQPMQATWSEWQAWGGEETCQDCHMPAGRHTFRGAHDVDFLRESLDIRQRGDVLELRSVGVGHHLPTGDLFRNLTVEASGDGGWQTLHRIGRSFSWEQDPVSLEQRKVLAADTSLRPGEVRRVRLPADAVRWRVRFHYGAEHDEHRGLVPAESLIVTLREADAAP